MIVGGVLLVAVLVLAAVLASRSSDEDAVADADSNAGPSTDVDDDGSSPRSEDGGNSGPGGGPSEPTTSPAAVTALRPVSVSATNTRESADLRCGGTADYGEWNLFDENPNTGWGASADDGAGQSVRVDLGGEFHLTRVGITPGFTKVGARFDQGCNPVNAFPFNRFVAEVQWSFDDGSTERQTFRRSGALQFTQVDTTTRTVTMTIVRTEYQGWDNDTVISSMEVRGSR